MSWSIYVFCRLPLLLFPFVGIQNSKLCPSSSSCLHMCPENFLFDLAVLFKVWTLKVEMNIVRLLFNIGIFCLVFANFSSAAIPGTTWRDSCLSAWQSMRHEFCVILFVITFFRLLIWELMDARPTNNRDVLPRTTVTLSQNTPGCICLWALPSPCCQRFDHLFVWILPFDLPGLVRPARSWSFRQYSSQGCGITQAHCHYKADDFRGECNNKFFL